MSRTSLQATGARPAIPITGSSIGVVPTSPLTGTTLQAIIDELATLLAPGPFLQVINGGGGTVQAHGNFGSTETIDLANGNWHWGTLNASCTFTFTTIADTKDREFWLELIEDGTGGWTPTFPGSVVFPGGTPTHDTTAGTTTIYGFITRDGGTTWIGGVYGGGGSASSITVQDEGITLTTALASLNFTGDLVTATTSGDDVTVDVASSRITAATIAALGFVGPILIADGASIPFAFEDALQSDDAATFLYADL